MAPLPQRDQLASDGGIKGGGQPLFAGRQASRLGSHGAGPQMIVGVVYHGSHIDRAAALGIATGRQRPSGSPKSSSHPTNFFGDEKQPFGACSQLSTLAVPYFGVLDISRKFTHREHSD